MALVHHGKRSNKIRPVLSYPIKEKSILRETDNSFEVLNFDKMTTTFSFFLSQNSVTFATVHAVMDIIILVIVVVIMDRKCYHFIK